MSVAVPPFPPWVFSVRAVWYLYHCLQIVLSCEGEGRVVISCDIIGSCGINTGCRWICYVAPFIDDSEAVPHDSYGCTFLWSRPLDIACWTLSWSSVFRGCNCLHFYPKRRATEASCTRHLLLKKGQPAYHLLWHCCDLPYAFLFCACVCSGLSSLKYNDFKVTVWCWTSWKMST